MSHRTISIAMKFFTISLLLTLLCLMVSVTKADTCNENCPTNTCSANNCLCGKAPNKVNIVNWCAKYVGWNQKCCQCIVGKESRGNTNAQHHNAATNKKKESEDVGLFQINSVNWPSCNSGKAPCDPDANLKCAIAVYKAGSGGVKNSWNPWTTAEGCGCRS